MYFLWNSRCYFTVLYQYLADEIVQRLTTRLI